MNVTSQSSATVAPRPAAGPLIAAIVGASAFTMFCTRYFGPRVIDVGADAPRLSSVCGPKSPPAQKAVPAPVSTIAPMSGSVPRSRNARSNP